MAAGGPFDWCATDQSSGVFFVFWFSFDHLDREMALNLNEFQSKMVGRTNKIKMNGMWRDGRTRRSDALRLVAAS